MKLKGIFDPSTTYSIGDTVKFTDDHVYFMQKTAPAGTAPTNPMFWGKVDQTVEQCVLMILDAAGEKRECQADAAVAELKKQFEALKKRVVKLEKAKGGAE